MNMPSELQTLGDLLLDTGMLQFGRFWDGKVFVPLRISFDYLPAYPYVLHAFTASASERITGLKVDRLLTAPDTLALGVTMGLQSEISVVYSRGRGEDPAFDLVGAYNSGHRTLLITNVLNGFDALKPLIGSAHRVGLDIVAVLALVELTSEPAPDGLNVQSILRMPELIHDLANRKRVPAHQVEAILDWLREGSTK